MTTATTNTAAPTDAPALPMTVSEAAAYWKCSRTTVKRLVTQGRVKAERRGGDAHRAATILIWQTEKPPLAVPGTLTDAQRSAWNKGKRGKKAKAS